jgi:hypothetical protein
MLPTRNGSSRPNATNNVSKLLFQRRAEKQRPIPEMQIRLLSPIETDSCVGRSGNLDRRIDTHLLDRSRGVHRCLELRIESKQQVTQDHYTRPVSGGWRSIHICHAHSFRHRSCIGSGGPPKILTEKGTKGWNRRSRGTQPIPSGKCLSHE